MPDDDRKYSLQNEKECVLGVEITVTTFENAVAGLRKLVEARQKSYVCVVPLHSIIDCQRSESLRQAFNTAALCTPDGMSVVWALKLRGFSRVSRVYGPDLLRTLCAGSELNHFFLGGAQAVNERLVAELRASNPFLRVAGTHSPPFGVQSAELNATLVESINSSAPDVVWVALGSPRQEQWMYEVRPQIEAPLMIGVGAAFDFIAGYKRQAPYWVQRGGGEWLFRWVCEPRRLSRRYSAYFRYAPVLLWESITRLYERTIVKR